MNLQLQNEHLAWDNTSMVKLLAVDRTVAQEAVVPIAKGRNIRSREKSPSDGVYAGYERNWHIPAVLLPPDWRIKPGDKVIEIHAVNGLPGVAWTVLTAEWDRLKQRWMLGTVDLILALDLSDTVTIERATLGYDASGVAVKLFPPAGGLIRYQLTAHVQQITEEIADERGERYSQGRCGVIIGSQVPLVDVAEDRVNWPSPQGTVYLDIVSMRNPQRIDELPVLECERRR